MKFLDSPLITQKRTSKINKQDYTKLKKTYEKQEKLSIKWRDFTE